MTSTNLHIHGNVSQIISWKSVKFHNFIASLFFVQFVSNCHQYVCIFSIYSTEKFICFRYDKSMFLFEQQNNNKYLPTGAKANLTHISQKKKKVHQLPKI